MDFEKKKTIMEHNFVFSLWKNPKLYSRYINKIDKMEKLFDSKDANFFYVVGKQMYKAGFEQFDEASVLSFVSGNDMIKDAFIKKGGYGVYEAAKSHLEGDNAEGYFNEIIKINCLNDLQNNGINIENDYHKLSQMSVEQIKMFYSYKLNNIFLTKSSTTHIDDMDITDEDLMLLNSGAQMGLSIASVAPLLNYEILGINRGLSFIGGAVNQGKTAFCCGVVVRGFLSQGIKTVLISNEQTLMEFKQLFLAMAVNEIKENVDRRRIKIGHYGTKEWEVLRAAKDHYNTYYAPFLKFAKIFDYSLEDVQTIVSTMSARGYKGFIYDVFKAEDGTSGRVVEEMKEMSKALFKTADETDSYVVATIQLGLSFSDVRNLHMGVISTSKHITEPATETLLLREMWDDECTGEKNDIKIYNYKYDRDGNKMIDKATGKPIKQYIEVFGEDYRQIKLLFVAKTRNTDRGICIAYKFNGAYNKWKELGYCTPSYENRNSNKKG